MTIFVWLWLALFASAPSAHAEEGCTGDQPLVENAWEIPSGSCSVMSEPIEWRLPISASKPEVLTAARVRVFFEKPDAQSNWQARVQFSFPDPMPFGIPFTFQKFKLSWQGNRAVEVDWSDSCVNVGRGLFPGQKFEAVVELPDTRDECDILSPSFSLWGGRY